MEFTIKLDAVVDMASKMREIRPESRGQLHFDVTSLVNDIYDESLDRHGRDTFVAEYIARLRWSFAAIARFDDGNGYADDQHVVWILSEVDKLKSQLECNEEKLLVGEAAQYI